jgi:hypothetical protein
MIKLKQLKYPKQLYRKVLAGGQYQSHSEACEAARRMLNNNTAVEGVDFSVHYNSDQNLSLYSDQGFWEFEWPPRGVAP